VYARNPRATWESTFADGLNSHSRCVFGEVNMVIDGDKWPPTALCSCAIRIDFNKVTLTYLTLCYVKFSFVAEFAQMDRKAHVSHSDLDVRPSKINRQQLMWNVDEH